jgi:hypothetical protein
MWCVDHLQRQEAQMSLQSGVGGMTLEHVPPKLSPASSSRNASAEGSIFVKYRRPDNNIPPPTNFNVRHFLLAQQDIACVS